MEFLLRESLFRPDEASGPVMMIKVYLLSNNGTRGWESNPVREERRSTTRFCKEMSEIISAQTNGVKLPLLPVPQIALTGTLLRIVFPWRGHCGCETPTVVLDMPLLTAYNQFIRDACIPCACSSRKKKQETSGKLQATPRSVFRA